MIKKIKIKNADKLLLKSYSYDDCYQRLKIIDVLLEKLNKKVKVKKIVN